MATALNPPHLNLLNYAYNSATKWETHASTLSRAQMMTLWWFPATVKEPKTAATFGCLEFFHLLTFESKASVFEFHNTLSKPTDNARAMNVPVRFLLL